MIAAAVAEREQHDESVGRDGRLHVDGPQDITVDWYLGCRSELRPLFELAEDSQSRLDEYLPLGRVLVAVDGPLTVGHLHLVPTARAGEIELKNMAVQPDRRGSGAGRALVVSALLRCAADGWSRMVVATAAADTGNLRFYQRLGFRLQSVDRDAFTAATGYPVPIVIDGVPLLDRVWLARDLHLGRRDAQTSPE